jgi:L-ascorbate metabolism protein UlaG (beta-lactamase superfamily)
MKVVQGAEEGHRPWKNGRVVNLNGTKSVSTLTVLRWELRRHLCGRQIVELDLGRLRGDRDRNITLVSAVHWSRRGLADEDRSIWGGFVVEAAGRAI